MIDLCALAAKGSVVDATSLYHSLLDRDRPVALYEDHPDVAPPLDAAVVGYTNQHGNVLCSCLLVDDTGTQWETAEHVDWDRVRWRVLVFVVMGGRSAKGPLPTMGPMHAWSLAVYDDGEPADLHWVQLCPDIDMTYWDMANLVLLGTLNFLNASNVTLEEPTRQRAAAKRIARTGVQVHELVVRPVGRRSRSSGGDAAGAVPLTSVRGHWARYGERYGRGLLFGRYEGRFWIPSHARGSEALGESRHDYRIAPLETP